MADWDINNDGVIDQYERGEEWSFHEDMERYAEEDYESIPNKADQIRKRAAEIKEKWQAEKLKRDSKKK